MNRKQSPAAALRLLGFRQTLKGALIIGVLVSILLGVQGFGYTAAYPDEKSRAQFAASIESAPALGVLYGEPDNLLTPAGYIVYRVVPFMGLIAALYGLLTATKLFRGQEEDGRLELIASGNTTSRKTAWHILQGFILSLFIGFVLSSGVTIAIGQAHEINASLGSCLLINLAIFLPALLFASLGLFTSQLSLTRRRAVTYGLIPLLLFFALRAVGNTISDFYWLKNLTPFGWAERLNPVINPDPVWLLSFVVTILLLISAAIYLTSKRDLGMGLIHESQSSKSRFYLLSSMFGFSLRENILLFLGWGAIALAVSALFAAISGVAVQSLIDSPNLGAVIAKLGGSTKDLKIAFLGAGMLFTAIILLLTSASSMQAIRRTEAKNYLDNLLVQPIRRSSWLLVQLAVTILMTILISLACAFITWLLAKGQDVSLDLGTILLVSIALTGTTIITLGLGTLLYGFLPRIAVILMYVAIAWSFLIDIIGSFVTLSDWLVKSSLFHYISLSINKAPDWQTFLWLISIGLFAMLLGTVAFTKRDIISE